MSRNTNRKSSEEILKEAKSYLDKLNLSSRLDAYFEMEMVRNLLREKYTAYENGIKNIRDNMPKVVRMRADEIMGEATGKFDDFVDDVKYNMMCNIVKLIKALEDFVPVDENITRLFVIAFTDEADGKMFEMLKRFSDGLANLLTEEFLKVISMPSNLPPDVAAMISVLGGGGIAFNLDEFEEFIKEDDGDCPDESEGEEGNNCC